jgi:hypothetical protein
MMNNEDFDRKMEFILNQQAQTAETVSRLGTVTFAGFKNVNANIDALANSQILTDEKLRIFIATVDRHINEGHNSA